MSQHLWKPAQMKHFINVRQVNGITFLSIASTETQPVVDPSIKKKNCNGKVSPQFFFSHLKCSVLGFLKGRHGCPLLGDTHLPQDF